MGTGYFVSDTCLPPGPLQPFGCIQTSVAGSVPWEHDLMQELNWDKGGKKKIQPVGRARKPASVYIQERFYNIQLYR